MIFASLDLEFIDDPATIDLHDSDPANPWRFCRLVQFARRANYDGRVVLSDGRAATAKMLARAHYGDSVEAWERFLDTCAGAQLIEKLPGEDCWTITDFRRWSRKPSEGADQISERVARWRAKNGVNTGVTFSDVTVTSQNVTVTQHSTAQHSYSTEHSTITDTEHSTEEHGTGERFGADATPETCYWVTDHSMVPWAGKEWATDFLTSANKVLSRLGPVKGRTVTNLRKFLSQRPPQETDPDAWASQTIDALIDGWREAAEANKNGRTYGPNIAIIKATEIRDRGTQ